MFLDYDDDLPSWNDPDDTVYGTYSYLDDELDAEDDHPSLTAAERNPSLCRQ